MSKADRTVLKEHSGFISLEIALVLIISAIIGFVLIQQQARSAKKEVARVQADQLQQIADALNSYTDLYRRDLVVSGNLNIDIDGNGTTDVTIPATAPGGTAPEGSKLRPTISNLISAGLLPAGFQNRPAASNGQFVTRLTVLPAGCSAIADNCRIEGYVAINQPVTTGGGVFDGDIMGDALSFMGGNGFATLAANQAAVSSGGNFTVALDLDGNGTADTTTNPGLVGMRVGATASRVDVRDPVPGVDFCVGNNQLVGWRGGALAGGGLVYPTNTLASPNTGGGTAECSAQVLSDTPVGYRFIQTDADSGGGGGGASSGGAGSNPAGSILLKCVFNEMATPPAQFIALTACCQTGNQSCTPPPPPA